MILALYNWDGKQVVQIALIDIDPAPDDPEEGYFIDLDIVPHDDMSEADWRDFIEELAVTDENGALLTPDDGEEYLEGLALLFRTPYLAAVLE
jgi:hypothetical protein